MLFVGTKKLTDTPTYMQNRELSWLKFNERVLQESDRIEHPLLERLKFISIFTTNLDEFFMVRVGSIIDYVLLGTEYIDNKTGMSAQEQLDEIFKAVAPLYKVRDLSFLSTMEGLGHHGLKLLKMQELSDDEIKSLRKYFTQNIEPLLSPQIVDSRHPFPHLANKQLHIAVTLESKKGTLFGLIALPPTIDRKVHLEGDNYRFVLLEELIMYFADSVFGIYNVLEKNVIAVTRNADINMEEDSTEDTDYRQHMKALLRKRQRLSPVRLELNLPASKELLKFLCEKLRLNAAQVFYSSVPIDLSFCFSLSSSIDKQIANKLTWPVYTPTEIQFPERKKNILKNALSKDMLFSYPFESMQPFLELMSQAAQDPLVLSIKITLYRIDIQSKLAESLLFAVENGKEVTVLMELRARFDENNNIEWAQRLEEAGCRIIYGLPSFKVHSKICLITRKEFGKLQYITQIGTGNYNEKTARQYTDLSLITSNQEIGRDASNFFSNMLLGNIEGNYTKLLVAPYSFKNNIIQCIEDERQKAIDGIGGHIIIKCNSLTDKDIIESLMYASRDGVRISMIIRGICCLVPQIPSLTENIRVISIIGRFLEHSRIYCFGTGAEQKIYISSADLMTRNTQRRVEVACPILDPDLKYRVYQMLDTMLMDNTQAWEQYSDGRYISRYQQGNNLIISSQEIFAENALLSTINEETEKSKNISRISLMEYIRFAGRKIFRK